jgi:hypothetical protein
MPVCQNLVPLVNIKIAGKWMFIPLKMVLNLGRSPLSTSTTETEMARCPHRQRRRLLQELLTAASIAKGQSHLVLVNGGFNQTKERYNML